MAEILVNKGQWDAVSSEERSRITEALRSSGAIREEDSIVGSPDVEAFTEDTQMEPMWNPIREPCKAACDVAATAAAGWCTANTAGVGLAACLAAAEAARRECRKRC